MLSALHYAIDLIAEHEHIQVDLAQLDLDDDEVYAMLRQADSVGVFQVESRAQMATLPRLKPREFCVGATRGSCPVGRAAVPCCPGRAASRAPRPAAPARRRQ